MKVILNGLTFIVKWKHPTYTHQPDARTARGTECTVIAEGGTGVGGVYLGQAICSAKIQFRKDKGRKVSLAHALKKMSLNKPKRKVFWDEYLKQGGVK